MPTLPERIYQYYCDKVAQETERRYFGASECGHECDRYLWLNFRKAFSHKWEGRMLRLFDTGHRAESRFVDELSSIGFDVRAFDKDGNQFAAESHNGHKKGHLDGVAKGDGRDWFLVEFKTHSAKSFRKLEKDGLDAFPKHFAQMQYYMGQKELSNGLYMAENKDNSEVMCIWVAFCASSYKAIMERSERIIMADRSPECLDDWSCKFCNARGVCKGEEIPRLGCRTCVHSTPGDNGKWVCEIGGEIPAYVEREGCPEHLYHPHMMPWEAVDSGDGWILYANGVCNCAPKGMPTITDDNAPVIYASEELALLDVDQVGEAVEMCKQMFGGKVVEDA